MSLEVSSSPADHVEQVVAAPPEQVSDLANLRVHSPGLVGFLEVAAHSLARIVGGDSRCEIGVATRTRNTSDPRGWIRAGSDHKVVALGKLQHEIGEGPSIDAFATGRPRHASALRTEPHAELLWPIFTLAARRSGVDCLLAQPMVVGSGDVLGLLALYSPHARTFDGDLVRKDVAAYTDSLVKVIVADLAWFRATLPCPPLRPDPDRPGLLGRTA